MLFGPKGATNQLRVVPNRVLEGVVFVAVRVVGYPEVIPIVDERSYNPLLMGHLRPP
jgi:hypothetical protein